MVAVTVGTLQPNFSFHLDELPTADRHITIGDRVGLGLALAFLMATDLSIGAIGRPQRVNIAGKQHPVFCRVIAAPGRREDLRGAAIGWEGSL